MQCKLPVLLLLAAFALPTSAATPQQEKMKGCNADAAAKQLSGEERKKFMSECLSAGKEAKGEKPLTAQQQKMKDCNMEAKTKGLKGEERKKFMSACLSKS